MRPSENLNYQYYYDLYFKLVQNSKILISRYNYSFHATKHTKENVRLDIISSVVRATASIYWITINTIQLKLYYKKINAWEMYITKKFKNSKSLKNMKTSQRHTLYAQ